MSAPIVAPVGFEPAERPIQVDVYESDNTTFVDRLTTDITGSRGWVDDLFGIGDFGEAQVTVPLYVTSEDLAGMIPNSEAALLTRGRVLRFSLDGVERFSAVIRPRRQTSVSTAGYPALTRTVRARGLLSEWDRATMPPAPGAELFQGTVRNFGWMSREVDTSEVTVALPERAVYADGYEHPEPWIDAFGSVYSAVTDRYFTFDQIVEVETYASLHIAFAPNATIYLDSVEVGQGDRPPANSWPNSWHVPVRLAPGTHRWGVRIDPGVVVDPRWCATLFEINDPTTGQMNGDTILWRTGYITGVDPYLWRASSVPIGPTAKQIIAGVLSQVMSVQGVLEGWSVDGEDVTLDANGVLLDRINHVPFTVGDPLGSKFLRGMAAAWCDLAVDVEGKRLYVYRWRERGTYHLDPGVVPIFSDAAFSPVEGRLPNILSLTHEERAQ